MKKLLALSVASLFVGSAMANAPVTQGQVTFTGNVAAQTCSIVVGDQAKDVLLDTVWAHELDAGTVTYKKEFTLSVEKCSVYGGKVAELKFNPSPDNVENGVLKNTFKKAKTNVGIKVSNEAGKNVLLADTAPASINLSQDQQPTLTKVFNYTAEYAKTDSQPAQAGIVSAVLPFVIEYK